MPQGATAVEPPKKKTKSVTETASGQAMAPPPRQQRRPALIAAAVALVCLGALLAAWAWSSTAGQEVLAVRQDVWRGQAVTEADLVTVRVGVDPALKAVPADRRSEVIGRRAATDLPAGGLVVEGAIAQTVLPAQGKSVIGVALTAAMMPADQVKPGDSVRLVLTPGQGGAPAATEPPAVAATVVGVTAAPDGGGTIVNVEVGARDAAMAAARAATGKLALVLDSSQAGQ